MNFGLFPKNRKHRASESKHHTGSWGRLGGDCPRWGGLTTLIGRPTGFLLGQC